MQIFKNSTLLHQHLCKGETNENTFMQTCIEFLINDLHEFYHISNHVMKHVKTTLFLIVYYVDHDDIIE